MNVDGSDPTLLYDAAGGDGQPDVASDGTWLVWLHGDGPEDIMTMNADGSGARVLSTATAFYGFPRISPDGKRIVYSRVTSWTTGTAELWVMNRDGTAPMRLQIPDSLGARSASWSPDGERLVFDVLDGSKLWVLDLRDSSLTQIYDYTGRGAARSPAWSPNGAVIGYCNDTVKDLHLIAPNGASDVIVAKSTWCLGDLAWSQDGQRFAYTAAVYSGGQQGSYDVEVHVFDLAGGTDSQLTQGPGQSDQPTY